MEISTTMKRTLAIITLTLLMVASVFATTDTVTGGLGDTNTKSVTTEVVLTLAKTPNYAFGITKGTFTPDSTTLGQDPSKISVTHEKSIGLQKNSTNVLNVDSTSAYYLSYFFYEYAGVKLTMSVDGNLCNQTTYDKTDETIKAANEIEYTIKVSCANKTDNTQTGGTASSPWSSTTTDFTIKSADGNVDSNKFSLSYTATDKLGDYRWASLQLTIAPVTTTNTLKGKVIGTYKSTITLTVSAS